MSVPPTTPGLTPAKAASFGPAPTPVAPSPGEAAPGFKAVLAGLAGDRGGNGAVSEDRRSPRDGAERWNEHGFFKAFVGEAVRSGPGRVGTTADSPAAAQGAAVERGSPLRAAEIGAVAGRIAEGAAMASAGDVRSMVRISPATLREAPPPALPAALSPAGSAVVPRQPLAKSGPPHAGQADASGVSARPLPPRKPPAGSGGPMVQLSVSADQAASFVGRVERLSREDRARLRQEIADLLARHGFAPADIRLNGESAARSPSSKETR